MLSNTSTTESMSSAPAPRLILVFHMGFESLPLVLPQGGSDELDKKIMEWLRPRFWQDERRDER